MSPVSNSTTSAHQSARPAMFKRLLAASFLFFLIKGLLWLGAAAWVFVGFF